MEQQGVDPIKEALKMRGWTLRMRARRKQQYVYAARRVGERVEERYLAPVGAAHLMACIERLPNGREVVAQQGEESGVSSGVEEEAVLPYHGETVDPEEAERSLLRAELLEMGRLMGYEALVLGAVNPEEAIVIRPGRESWALYGVGLSARRLRAVLAAARRYYEVLKRVGMVPDLEASSRVGEGQSPDQNQVELPTSEMSNAAVKSKGVRAQLKAIGKRLGYREVWFGLNDRTACRIPGDKEMWNIWCEDIDEDVVEKAVLELIRRFPE